VPLLIRNDTLVVNLRTVQPSALPNQNWDDVDLSTAAVVLGIGEYDKSPTGGTFPLTYGANTATALAYNITAAAVSTALNALASVISAGGVTVADGGTGIYTVTFSSVGARTLISSGTNTLTPASQVIISQLTAGDAGTAEVQVIRLAASLYATCSTWSAFASAADAVTVLAAGSGSTQNIQVVTLNPLPYAGVFTITTSLIKTPALAFNSTAQQVQDALNVGGTTTDYSVSGNAGGPWTITKTAVGSVATNTVDVTGLSVPIGLTGTLALSTLAMIQRLATVTSDTISLILEIQVTPLGGGQATILQVPVTISKDVINFSSLTPSPASSYPTFADLSLRVNNSVHSLATLATVATTAITVNNLMFFVNDTDAPYNATPVVQGWQLIASTAATAAGVQRPTDYDGSTNAKVWFQRL
jgi:hypothetical protein